jgi:hypothetical protein
MRKLLISAIVLSSTILSSQAQIEGDNKKFLNSVTTSVPFLGISPDARAGGMGDLGVATSPDANSMHWNLAKLAFIDKELGLSLSYTPWLRNLVPDINMAYLSFYQKFGQEKDQAFSASLRYFSLGDIIFTDINGNTLGTYYPNEFAIDAGYARKLSENFSMAIGFRFIYSDLTQGQIVAGASTFPGVAASGDISLFYQKPEIKLGEREGTFRFGTAITNIGSKIRYSENALANFIPINLRLGPSLSMDLDDYNSLSFMVEFNKLLVPTAPIYARDSQGNIIVDPNTGERQIEAGMDPNPPVIQGIIQSFYDAPGGFNEELREWILTTGIEYWYDKQFAVRAGFLHENQFKGNRRYATMGIGVRYNIFSLDFSYLIPTQQRNPLENTLRFSLSFDIESLKSASGGGSGSGSRTNTNR